MFSSLALLSQQFSRFAVLLLILPVLSSILRYQASGLAHGEHRTTLPHLLSDKSIPAIIFDVEHMESPPSRSNFQARELSYFVDYLDARFMVLFGKWGWAHYLSTMKFLFVGLITGLCWWLSRHSFRLSPLQSFLLCFIFLTTPCVYHFVYFHHSAKIGVALFAFGFLCWAAYRLRGNDERPLRTGAIAGLILLFGCLFDMQGVYFCVAVAAVLAVQWYHHRGRQLVALSVGSIAALVGYCGYRFLAGPKLIEHFAGYAIEKPYFGSLAWPKTVEEGSMHYSAATELFIEYLRYFLGSFPAWIAGLILLLVLLLHLFAGGTPLFDGLSSRRKWKIHEEGLVFIFSILAGIGMIFLMGLKFHWLYLPAIRPVYYALPLTVCFLFGLCFTVRRLLDWKPRATLWVSSFLIAVALGNVRFVPYWDHYLQNTGWRWAVSDSPGATEMIRALRQLRSDGHPVPSYVEKDAVYAAVRERILQP